MYFQLREQNNKKKECFLLWMFFLVYRALHVQNTFMWHLLFIVLRNFSMAQHRALTFQQHATLTMDVPISLSHLSNSNMFYLKITSIIIIVLIYHIDRQIGLALITSGNYSLLEYIKDSYHGFNVCFNTSYQMLETIYKYFIKSTI